MAGGGREADKSSRDSLFSTVVTWTTLKSDEDQICPKDAASIIVKTEYFFQSSGLTHFAWDLQIYILISH